MKNAVAKGSITLIVSGLICKVLGAFFRLPLTNILGIEGIGVFQMIMSLYSFALVFSSGGITTTLSRIVSSARARGDVQTIQRTFRTSLIFSIIFGLFLGLIFCVFARGISTLQGNVLATSGYRLMLLLLPFGGIIACFRGVIQGYENMLPTAVSQILEQIIKFGLGLLFAFLFAQKSAEMGVFGAFLGIVCGELLAILYLFLVVRKMNVRPVGTCPEGFFKTLIPLSVGMSVLPFVGALDSLIIVGRLSLAGFVASEATSLFGLQTGVVGAILNFPLIISISLATALLPSISYMNSGNKALIEESISKALKNLWIVLLPIVLGIVAVARPLYAFVYPSLTARELDFAVGLTQLGGVSTIITALMQFFVSILQAQGKFVYTMVFQIIGGVVKVGLVVLLCALPGINIYGLPLGNIALSSIVCIGALAITSSSIKLPVFDLLMPLISAFAMFFIVSAFVEKVIIAGPVLIISAAAIGASIYFVFALPCILPILEDFFGRKAKEEG